MILQDFTFMEGITESSAKKKDMSQTLSISLKYEPIHMRGDQISVIGLAVWVEEDKDEIFIN